MAFAFLRFSPAAVAVSLLCASALAANEDIEARYQSERAACETAQDKAACLRDAAAAREAARRGQLESAQGGYDQNALARCAALPVEERDACVRRVRGEGVTQGSVQGGGVIREYTLPSPQVPVEPAPPR